MKAIERTVEQLLHGGGRYVMPVFQRYYIWDKKNWDQLWEDLEVLLPAGEEHRRHFLGSIVLIPNTTQPGVVPVFQVIDGQQRLITLSILLCAVRKIARD